MYMFVVVAYRAFWEYYPDNACYSLWNWLWISFDQTLKEQGLGKYLDPAYSEEVEESQVNLWRISTTTSNTFSLVYWSLLSFLVLSLISSVSSENGNLRSKKMR
jgi:hypothetical protein